MRPELMDIAENELRWIIFQAARNQQWETWAEARVILAQRFPYSLDLDLTKNDADVRG